MSRRSWHLIAVSFMLAALSAYAIAHAQVARGAAGDCDPCVMLIEVDGLEPKDVTPELTPYLWQLAHPTTAPTPSFANRAGWMWQAARGVMTANNASATASLLTGSYVRSIDAADEPPGAGTGVTADELWIGEDQAASQLKRTSFQTFGDPDLEAEGDSERQLGKDDIRSATNLFDLVSEGGVNDERHFAGYIGDPKLGPLAIGPGGVAAHISWYPKPTDTPPFVGDPSLCPVPRQNTEPNANHPSNDPRTCPASDMATMNKAMQDLKTAPASTVEFTYMQLAELGAIKRQVGDRDGDSILRSEDPTQPQAVQLALARTDAAIASFVEQYANDQALGQRWSKTVMMIVGNHGYEATPATHRVPDPNSPATPWMDLSNYVAAFRLQDQGTPPVLASDNEFKSMSGKMVAQGSLGTVYAAPTQDMSSFTPAQRAAFDAAKSVYLAELKLKLEGDELNEACQDLNTQTVLPIADECVAEVLYLSDPGLKDANGENIADSVPEVHPTWNLGDPIDPQSKKPVRVQGDLLVVLNEGWATGRLIRDPLTVLSGGDEEETDQITNAGEGSAGGPRNRTIAAIINGPSSGASYAVRQVQATGGRYPVTQQSYELGKADNPPPDDPTAAYDSGDTTVDATQATIEANRNPGDDADDTGYLLQAETVDFAPTIAALLRIQLPSEQIDGRILQEAFQRQLTAACFDCDEVEGEAPPDDVEELPAPPPPPPPQEDPFKCYKLLCKLNAQVVDGVGLTFIRAKPGSKFSSIRLVGDFGLPQAAVTLTFYKTLGAGAQASAKRKAPRRRGKVVRLKAIARFDPFLIKRGHNVLRLKVPVLFKPSHVGVSVQEAATVPASAKTYRGRKLEPCTKVRTIKKLRFKCFGSKTGQIVKISDSTRLHTKKPARSKRKSTPRRRR